MSRRLNHGEYTVAWIAVLHIEAIAAIQVLDHLHDGVFESDRGDDYIYIGGDVNGHNVVIATLPAGASYGVGAAAALATAIKSRFTNLWFALLVGVAAGLPHLCRDKSNQRDIRLGDVLVAVPNQKNGGVIHYDLGKDTAQGFLPHGRSVQPPSIVLSAISHIRLRHCEPFEEGSWFSKQLQCLYETSRDKGFTMPDTNTDVLHNENELVKRRKRSTLEKTRVWYGTIGSGNTLMRNSKRRDKLRKDHDLIGLEMEAAGVVHVLPTGIIRGVCDYGDEYKNKTWQPYAAAVAAVYAKGVLHNINMKSFAGRADTSTSPLRIDSFRSDSSLTVTGSVGDISKTRDQKDSIFVVPHEQNHVFADRTYIRSEIERLSNFDGKSQHPKSKYLIALYGLGGVGKSQVAIDFAYRFQREYSDHTVIWLSAKSGESVHHSLSSVTTACGISFAHDKPLNLLNDFVDWLERRQSTSILVIIDGADDMNVLFGLHKESFKKIIKCVHGTILVTSRNRTIATRIAGEEGCIVEVPTMDSHEAMCLLRSHFLSDFEQSDKRLVLAEARKSDADTRKASAIARRRQLKADIALHSVKRLSVEVENASAEVKIAIADNVRALDGTMDEFLSLEKARAYAGKMLGDAENILVNASKLSASIAKASAEAGMKFTQDTKAKINVAKDIEAKRMLAEDAEAQMKVAHDAKALDDAIEAVLAVERSRAVVEQARMELHEASIAANKLRKGAEKVSALLGYLPLALVQAANFVRENSISLSKYAEMWTESFENAQQLLHLEFDEIETGSGFQNAPNTVAAAVTLTLELVSERNPFAFELLSLVSFFGHTGVPEDLLLGKDMSVNNVKFVKALGELSALSLIVRNKSNHLLDMHRLIHMIVFRWQQKRLDQQTLSFRATRALSHLNRVFPRKPQKQDRPRLDLYLPHAIAYLSATQSMPGSISDTILLQRKIADHLMYQGRTFQAAAIQKLVLNIALKNFQSTDKEVFRAKYELASVLEQLRQFDDARALCDEIIAEGDDQKYSGLTYINSLSLLCRLLAEKGLYGKAYATLAMARKKVRANGANSEEDIIRIDIQDARIKRQEALSMPPIWSLQKNELLHSSRDLLLLSSQRLRSLLGVHANSYIVSLQHLTRVLDDLQGWKRSEETYKLIVQLRTETLGKDHPEVFRASRNLALFYVHRGLTYQAESVLQQTISRSESTLNKNHPDHLKTCRVFAQTLKKRAEYLHNKVEKQSALVHDAQGKIAMSQAEIDKTSLATMHDAANTRLNVLRDEAAELLKKKEALLTILEEEEATAIAAFKKAIVYQQKLLKTMATTLGMQQPDTLDAMSDLAGLMQRAHLFSGKTFPSLMGEAGQLLEDVAQHHARLHADDAQHEDVLSAKALLAAHFHERQHYEKAELLEREVLIGERARRGDRHVKTLQALQALAETLAAQNTKETWRMAGALLTKCIELSASVLGDEHKVLQERKDLLALWKTEESYYAVSSSSQRSIRIMQHHDDDRALRPNTVHETPRFSMSVRSAGNSHSLASPSTDHSVYNLGTSMLDTGGSWFARSGTSGPSSFRFEDTPASQSSYSRTLEVHRQSMDFQYLRTPGRSKKIDDQSVFEFDEVNDDE